MLINGLYSAGTKIEFIDSGMSLLSHSRGYMIGVSSYPDNRYYVTHSVVIVRRGKSGKPRLDLRKVNTPVFYLDSTEKKEAEYYQSLGLVGKHYLRATELNVGDLMKIDTFDFIGWATAKYMNLMTTQRNNIDIKGQFIGKNDFPELNKLKAYLGNLSDNGRVKLELEYATPLSRMNVLMAIQKIQVILHRCSKRAVGSKLEISRRAARNLLQMKRANKLKFSSIKELNAIAKGG